MAAKPVYLGNRLFQPVLYPVNHKVRLERLGFRPGLYHLHVHLLRRGFYRRVPCREIQPQNDHIHGPVPVCGGLVPHRLRGQHPAALHLLRADGRRGRRYDLPGLPAHGVKMVPGPLRVHFRPGTGRGLLRTLHHEPHRPGADRALWGADDLPDSGNRVPDRRGRGGLDDRALSGRMDARGLEAVRRAGEGA